MMFNKYIYIYSDGGKEYKKKEKHKLKKKK
jgi:hypothetical protein